MSEREIVRALDRLKRDATLAYRQALNGEFSTLTILSQTWHNLELALMEMDQELLETKRRKATK